MSDEKTDRRIQRTRELLRKALMELIDEKGYDAVTIQDITERANLGRTTFYLHYQSKEDLFLDHHEDFAILMQINPVNREQLLSGEPQPKFVDFLQQIDDNRELYYRIVDARDAEFILRGIRTQLRENLEATLKEIFDCEPILPLDVVTQYIVSAQLSTIQWWVTERNDHSPYEIAKAIHHLQRSIILNAYQVTSHDA